MSHVSAITIISGTIGKLNTYASKPLHLFTALLMFTYKTLMSVARSLSAWVCKLLIYSTLGLTTLSRLLKAVIVPEKWKIMFIK